MKHSFRFEAGAAARGQTKAALRRGAFDYGLTFSVEEEKHFLWSDYYVTIEGPEQNVRAYLDAVGDYFASYATADPANDSAPASRILFVDGETKRDH